MFLDISDRIFHNPPANHYGVAVTDVDGDGQLEFVVAGFRGPNRVLKWINGGLRDVAPPSLADIERQAISVAAGDFDGDGREEIYFLNTDTFAGEKSHADRLFDMQTDGHWHDLFSTPQGYSARNLAAGRSVAAIDRRGTGRYGFAVAIYGQPMRLYEMTPERQIADIAPALGINLSTGGRGLLVAPLTSDRPDLFCNNEQGQNFLFRNTGVGTFAEVADIYGLADSEENGRGVTALDADGDGRLDLCYGNWDGPHRLMIRKSDGTFRNDATLALALPSPLRTVVAADFDNDGREEIFFNNLGDINRLFIARTSVDSRCRVTVDWHLSDPGSAAEPDMLGTGAAIADIDNDGQLELLISHGEADTQPLTLYKAATNLGKSIRVRPLTRFGAPARGALVRLNSRHGTQVRVIDGGSGYLCQMEPVAHFGLGKLEEIDTITVTWPDGTIVMIENPEPGGTIYVRYPGA